MGFSPRVDATRLTDFAAAVYACAGLPEADARLVADTWYRPTCGAISPTACYDSAGTSTASAMVSCTQSPHPSSWSTLVPLP